MTDSTSSEKAGIYTSEFWTKNVLQLVIIVNMFLKRDIDPNIAVGAVAALEGLYIAGRSGVKAVRQLVAAWKTLRTED